MSEPLKRILKNMLIFAVILAVLIVIVLTALGKYTQHDSVITVPDVSSLTVDQAAPFFEKKNLRYKVVDSIRHRISTSRGYPRSKAGSGRTCQGK